MWRQFFSILGMTVLIPGAISAQESRLQADFTFKRITVPQSGSTNRINVQIAPRGPAEPYAPSEAGTVTGTGPVAGATPRASELDWFWEMIPPETAASQPGRLILALEAMRKAPEGKGVREPRLDALQKIASTYGTEILRQTVGTRVSPALVLSVIAVESSGDHEAISRVGAVGLMQLMPETAARFGVRDSLDPADNIRGGVAYLNWLMERFEDDPVLFLAAYNAGAGSIRDAGGVPDYAETRAYVPKVLAAWNVARALCVTPPELMSDGCVFSVR